MRPSFLKRRRTLQQQLTHYVAAIGAGVNLTSVVGKIKDLEQRLADTAAELDRLKVDRRRLVTLAQVEATLEAILVDWRGALRGNVTEARQMLRTLLIGQIQFVEERRDWKQGYTLTTDATSARLVSIVFEGIRTCRCTTHGVPSRSQLEPDFGVSQRNGGSTGDSRISDAFMSRSWAFSRGAGAVGD